MYQGDHRGNERNTQETGGGKQNLVLMNSMLLLGERRFLALAGCAVLIVSALVVIWRFNSKREPVYEGKPLSAWLEEYEKTFRLWNKPPNDGAREAIVAIGADALPFLLKYIATEDPLNVKWQIQKVTGGPAHPTDSPKAYSHSLGIAGFAALQERAKPAEDALARMLANPKPLIRRNAAISLGYMGHAGVTAIPELLAHVEDEDREVSRAAIWALGNLGQQSDYVVPKLVELASRKYPSVEIFDALAKFGDRARTAIPKLKELAEGRDPAVALLAVETAERIDAVTGAELRGRLRGRKP